MMVSTCVGAEVPQDGFHIGYPGSCPPMAQTRPMSAPWASPRFVSATPTRVFWVSTCVAPRAPALAFSG